MDLHQPDLFGQAAAPHADPRVMPVSGLDLACGIISEVEEAALIGRIDAEALTPFQFQ